MKIGEAFPSKYLKCSDLQGQTIAVTIEKVTMEALGMGKDKDQKPVVYFRGKDKGLACNKTNANMIAEIAKTDETDDWRGVRIALKPARVDFQGQRVDAIRVDYPSNGAPAQRPAAAPAPVQPYEREMGDEPDDDIRF